MIALQTIIDTVKRNQMSLQKLLDDIKGIGSYPDLVPTIVLYENMVESNDTIFNMFAAIPISSWSDEEIGMIKNVRELADTESDLARTAITIFQSKRNEFGIK